MPTKNRQQLLTIVAVAAIALLALDRILLPPLAKFFRDRSAQIADLRTKVADGRQLLRRDDAIRGRWESMRTNTLPNNNSAAEQQVVNAFYKWEQDSRVSIT